jgi:uncharacterized protein (DUF924 family)
MHVHYRDILTFWFEEASFQQWFSVDAEFDKAIRSRFSETFEAAVAGELWCWREEPYGRLAEIIVIDQFARNLYRDSAQAYAFDPMALVLSQEAVRAGADRDMRDTERMFLYMPHMHSESPAIHEEMIALFEQLDIQEAREAAHEHKHIIDRFGRYPHRNEVLGRQSTKEERAFLKEFDGFGNKTAADEQP